MTARPQRVGKNLRQKTSILSYSDKEDDARNGDYYMRGGVCWPIDNPLTGPVGHVVVLGYHVTEKKTYILEDRAFACIDHILGPGRRIEFEGLAPWFNLMWATYFCDTYFYHQDDATHRAFGLQVIRSEMVNPKPYFIEAPWRDDDQAAAALWRGIHTGHVSGKKGTELHSQLQRYEANKTAQWPPAVRALISALVGLERFPYRVRKEES